MISFQKSGQSGMSLIEVMVALVILGFMCAALMGLFLAGSRDTAVARHDLMAVSVAQEILDQVKAIPENQLGTVQSATANNIRFENVASAADDAYVGQTVALTSGKGSGQVRVITGYDGDTRTAAVDSPWDTVPDETTEYAIFNGKDTTYPYRVEIGRLSGALRTVTVTVTYQAAGAGRREVALTSERLRR